MKHTKGPWYSIDECIYAKIQTVDGTYVQPMIASCSKFTTAQHDNARLIAAAPEMLKALEAVFSVLQMQADHSDWTEDSDEMRTYSLVKRAIKKAKGEI